MNNAVGNIPISPEEHDAHTAAIQAAENQKVDTKRETTPSIPPKADAEGRRYKESK